MAILMDCYATQRSYNVSTRTAIKTFNDFF